MSDAEERITMAEIEAFGSALDFVRGGGGLHCVTLQEPAPRGA